MVHKFATKGGLAQALHKKTRQFYDTRLYQTCAITLPLPSNLQRKIRHLIDELVDYRDQIINIVELEMAIIEERPKDMNVLVGFLFAQLVVITNFDNPCAAQELEKLAPRFLEWYQWLGGTKLALSQGVRDRIADYRRSKSIFDRTPTEATRIFKAGSRHRPRLHLPPGSIQVNFYFTLEKGKYGPVCHEPDFMTSLYVDPSRGVHLGELRKKLGVESIAIITDRAPFRTVFEAANEDWLSPMAVWDLTKQCTRPLRVFEHRVSQSTKVKRFIREPIYLAIVFLFTFLKLIFGYPEKDIAYMGALYGPRYAKVYNSLGHISVEANRVAFHGARLLFKSTIFFCVVPVMALYTIVFSVLRTTQLVVLSTFSAVGSAISTLALAVSTGAAATFSFATTLGMKGWLVIFGVLWLGLAEYYSMT